jgi:cobalt/nickel transport system permease protein
VHSDGLRAAAIFVLRVGASVSLAILLILTTRWADILKSLRVLRVPTVFVIVLSMTYRYVFLLLHTANGMFLARKSRMVARTSGKEERWWIVSAIGVLMHRSFRMSEDVYQAMLARGFQNEIRTLTDYRLRPADWLMLAISVAAAGIAIYAGQVWL